jgi:hypothetical protein
MKLFEALLAEKISIPYTKFRWCYTALNFPSGHCVSSFRISESLSAKEKRHGAAVNFHPQISL